MHDHSARAVHNRRHKSATSAALVAAALFLLSPIPAKDFAFAASKPIEESALAAVAPVLRSKAAHDIAIEIVKPGNEGLEFTARLSESAGLIERDISWTLRDSQGTIVYEKSASVASIAVPPGDYAVDVVYGAASFSQSLTLLQANHLLISFVLDVGGIRVLPRLKGLGPVPTQAQSRVYALSGPNRGKLVTMSKLPGEILRVEAGDYRIESRFATGNAVAVTDVHVKPGVMSAVEIDHAAGLARLSFVGSPATNVSWQVVDIDGVALPEISGLSVNYVLTPGTYVAKAQIGNELMTASFDITAGQERDILLGN